MNYFANVAAAAIVAAAVVTAPVHAQVDDQAKQVLTESAAAIKSLDSVAYSAKRSYTGPLEGLLSVTGEVKIVRPGEKTKHAVMWLNGQIALKDNPPTKFTVSTDGLDTTWVDYTNNTVYQRPAADRKARQQTQNVSKQLLMDAYVDPEPYGGLLKAEKVTRTGVEKVGGVDCEVIEAGTADGSRKTVYHIGIADRLPRREAMVTNSGNMSVAQVLELTDLKVNPGLTAKQLAVAVPTGFVKDFQQPKQALNNTPQPAPKVGVDAGSDAPSFALKSVGGKDVKLEDFQGNVVVLVFWGTRFAASKQCLDTAQQLTKFFKDEPIKFVAMTCREDKDAPDAAKQFVQENKYTFDVLLNADQTAAAYKVLGFPSLCVLTSDGKVSSFIQGCPKEPELLNAIERAAKSK